MSVEIAPADKGKADVYVDDIITIAVDNDENLKRITRAPITVMHAVADNSIFKDDTIQRKNIVAEDKMKAEGAAGEQKICLGWLIDTRSLAVRLPSHKVIAWTSQIDKLLESISVSNKELQSILGRLGNIAQIMTPLGHFLGNIRYMQIVAKRKSHNIRLNTQAKEDLNLAKSFIKKGSTRSQHEPTNF